ncbi:Outer membrane protein OmpA [Bosea sp. CRIB-10]|jgi:outer membrane protein OmpA-like peptidoglycan-associated protein|uniref:OmpA family protein n=1 Tax=Bosea sp. CRIB-10 TaxID=378404 RepID=UPI0008E19A32|nr:OmpA family protein [Bosea sp. CRIB-10]PZR96529.1 MAG: OmpA family protein [Stutzerimonas stutzeri]SFC63428.1 Outer membrane protein OmpA [Bosea sp. CRIB-10]
MKIADERKDNVELPQMMSRRALGGFVLSLPLLSAVPALAQTDQGATNILRSLAPHDRVPGSGGGRVVVRRTAPVPRRVRPRGYGQDVVIDLTRRVEVTVFFDNDSSVLRRGAEATLRRLADALRDPILLDQRFLIGGHTSADGDYDYNVELSRERASVVRDWLVSYGGIDSGRLVAHGFGPDMLRNPRSPYSPVNRRVEVIAITG